MQIPHSLRTIIQTDSLLRGETPRDREILRSLREWKKITIVEVEVSPDHVHILLEILSKFVVFSVVGFLKGKSGLQLYERSPELKFKYRNREFWCRGFYEDTAGKNAVKIAN